jgi:hypothetical protein
MKAKAFDKKFDANKVDIIKVWLAERQDIPSKSSLILN